MYNQINADNNDGLYDDAVKDSIRLHAPIDYVLTTTHSAETAYERVLAYAGACKVRDSFDEQMVSDVRNGEASATGKGNHKGIVDSQNDNKPEGAGDDWSAWPVLNSETAPADSDGDGMPDAWETANGLNPQDGSDGKQQATDGYTNLEHYLNSLVADITEQQYAGGEQGGYIEEEGEAPVTEVYEISPNTSNGDWTFTGGFKMDQSGSPATGSDGTIKYSSNKKYTLTLPEGITVDKVTIYGYCNADGATGYLGELAGNTYASTDYVYPPRNAEVNRATHTIMFEQPVTGKLSFTPKGDAQSCYKITLFTSTSTGISHILPSTQAKTCTYNLQGTRVSGNTKGLYIQNGKKFIKK
jgi:hypothetical protein